MGLLAWVWDSIVNTRMNGARRLRNNGSIPRFVADRAMNVRGFHDHPQSQPAPRQDRAHLVSFRLADLTHLSRWPSAFASLRPAC